MTNSKKKPARKPTTKRTVKKPFKQGTVKPKIIKKAVAKVIKQRKPTPKKPATKKPAAKKQTVKKPIKKKPAAKKPATKKASPKNKTSFTKGNEFWKARSSHGRKPKFKTPYQLWLACCEYFQWVKDNPLKEEKLFHYQGDVTRETVNHIRAMTISGLQMFIDISAQTWSNYKQKPDFLEITTRVDQMIYNQKFAGAAADLLNANIIARDLGLRDKQDVKHSGIVNHRDVSEMTDEELQAELDKGD